MKQKQSEQTHSAAMNIVTAEKIGDHMYKLKAQHSILLRAEEVTKIRVNAVFQQIHVQWANLDPTLCINITCDPGDHETELHVTIKGDRDTVFWQHEILAIVSTY